MRDKETILKALECSIRPATDCDPNCPYVTLEPIKEEFGIPADCYDDKGNPMWRSCDVDLMTSDAIDYIRSH